MAGKGEHTPGREYIRQQAARDTTNLEASLKQRRSAEIQTGLANGTLSWTQSLGSCVVLGDSRALAFSEYGYLDADRNLAVIGTNFTDMASHVQEVASRQPDRIIISYGLNDLQSFGGEESYLQGGYGQAFAGQVKQLAQASPSSHILINSILPPADDSAVNNRQNVDNFNAQLKDICQQNGWTYVDNDPLRSQMEYEADGQHFVSSFYGVWLSNIARTVWENEA